MIVVGTAGHVDHGKSSLVKSLTGVDPDRLKEEKTREMTIDLGFAWFVLPNGITVSLIDVPGHRDFIENMLAGVSGMDAVIFVIAADEGIMPQTREHLAILDLLEISTGVIVLTKCDLVSDIEWLDLIKKDVRQAVVNTFLEKAPIIPFSSKNGWGSTELIAALEEVLSRIPQRIISNTPRLSLDRVFSIKGFGTIVTGTLLDGILNVGDEIIIYPSRKQGRIRGIQSHNQFLKKILPGSRVAINISGLEVKDLHRGDLLTTSINFQPSLRVNTWVKILPDANRGLQQNDEIQVFHLAAKRMGKARIIGKNRISPGENGYVQIEFAIPLPVEKRDRFIIRYPSPEETIGGGIILDTCVSRRFRQNNADDLELVRVAHSGTSEQKLESLINKKETVKVKEIVGLSDIPGDECISLVSSMIENGSLIDLSQDEGEFREKTVITVTRWNIQLDKIHRLLSDFHKRHPLRIGMSREELCMRLKKDCNSFDRILLSLKNNESLVQENGILRLLEHRVVLTNEHLRRISKFNKIWDANPYSPPGVEMARSILGEELLGYLMDTGQVIQLADDIIFREQESIEMYNFVIRTIVDNGSVSVAEFRDRFGTSRKFALAYLEYLDKKGLTIRDGDGRKLTGNINK